MTVLIKSAKVIAPDSAFHQKTVNILIADGKLKKISESPIASSADRVIEGEGLGVSKGWFDSSVSFGEPGYEERETIANGLLTAAKSGFSVIALNPETSPVIDHHSAVDFLKHKAESHATALYPIGALTQGSQGEGLAELFDMSRAGAVAFGDYKRAMRNPNLLKIALQYAQGFDGLVQSFPLDEQLAKSGLVNEGPVSTTLGLKGIPTFTEEVQIARDLRILEYTGGKLHIPTITTAKSVALITAAKKKGLDVTCSVAIHNLFFTDEVLKEFDARYKVMPPLRCEHDRCALVEAVKNDLIDMVTADHQPVNAELKKLDFAHAAYGSIGLESAFGALNTLFGLEKSIALLTAGRRRFKIAEPEIKEGETADLSLFKAKENYTFKKNNIHSTSTNAIFLGQELKGQALGVYANQKLIITGDE